jgi:hypothetical protein
MTKNGFSELDVPSTIHRMMILVILPVNINFTYFAKTSFVLCHLVRVFLVAYALGHLIGRIMNRVNFGAQDFFKPTCSKRAKTFDKFFEFILAMKKRSHFFQILTLVRHFIAMSNQLTNLFY